MANEDLNLYHIPQIDTNLPQSEGNPADITISNGGNVVGGPTVGITEQQVRDIVGQNNSTGLKEDQVRAIINSALAPTLGTMLDESMVRTIVANAMRATNVMTEDKVRAIVNSMQKFLTGQNIMVDGIQKSQNFYTGVSGWQIDAEGNAEFNNGIFRGTFVIGGSLITVTDIADLQDAIDALELLGGGTAALAPDTYTATSGFTIPSGVTIDGNGATIDFGGGAYQFLAQGTNAYSTGTLAVSFNSANVVGTGTTWTAAMVGRSILIGDYWYTIATRTDNTHITITPNFRGVTVLGATYVIATTIDGVALKNIILQNSSITLFKYRYVNGLIMDGLVTSIGTQGIDGDDSAFIQWLNSGIDTCTAGMTFDNVPFITLDNSSILDISGGTALSLTGVSNSSLGILSIQNITGVGVKFTNSYNTGFINYSIIECTSHGIEFVSGNSDIDLEAGYIDTVGGDGIKLTATSDNNHIISQSILNCTGYGINIANSTCDNNTISINSFTTNTSGNIIDSGTNTRYIGNQGVQDNIGYALELDGNGDLQPKASPYVPFNDPFFELDSNGDVQPRVLLYSMGLGGDIVIGNTGEDYPPAYGAKAFSTLAQTITNNTNTKIILNALSFDLAKEFDFSTNNRYTVTAPGYYQVTYSMYWQNANSGSFYKTSVYKNGSETAQVAISPSNGDISQSGSALFYLVAGDYLELYAYQNSGGDETVFPGEAYTYLAVMRIN